MLSFPRPILDSSPFTESMKLERLANYSKPISSICIAIPPAGESYQVGSDSIKKSPSNLNVVQSNNLPENNKGDPAKSPESSPGTRKTPNIVLINDTWVLPPSSNPALARASLQYYVKVKNTDSPQFWAGETIIPSSRLSVGNHILTYEQVVGEDAVSWAVLCTPSREHPTARRVGLSRDIAAIIIYAS